MRTKAEKLEKGKWYADVDGESAIFLKFSHVDNGICHYSEQKGHYLYNSDESGMIEFTAGIHDDFIPTPEDIEKYGLIDDETT